MSAVVKAKERGPFWKVQKGSEKHPRKHKGSPNMAVVVHKFSTLERNMEGQRDHSEGKFAKWSVQQNLKYSAKGSRLQKCDVSSSSESILSHPLAPPGA